jgi:hypothetical protein
MFFVLILLCAVIFKISPSTRQLFISISKLYSLFKNNAKKEYRLVKFMNSSCVDGPPLWFSGQSSWLQIQRSLLQFLALPEFVRSSGSGKRYTQPREYN